MEKLILNKKNSRTFYIIGLLFATGLFLFTHLYKLDSILDMWHTDEVGLILNVKSLAKYGTDRYGNSYPMYPINFFSEQSPMFTYCYLLVYKLFGYSKFSIRLVTVIFSILGTVYWGKLYYLLNENKRSNTLMMVLAMSTFPSIVMLMRLGLDCNLMFTLVPVFFFYLLKAIYSRKKVHYIIAGIVCGIILYSYILSHVIMPLFLIALFIYLLRSGKIKFSDIVAFMVPVIILALPLIPFHIVNTFRLDSISFCGISYVHTPGNRISEFSVSQIPSQLIINLIPLLGFDPQPYETISYFGTIHWISIPFFIVGLIEGTKSIISGYKTRQFNFLTIVTIWFYIVYLCNSIILTRVYRLNPIYFSVIYLTIWGINKTISNIKESKRQMSVIAIAVAYIICFAAFAIYYFGGTYTQKYLPNAEDRICSYDLSCAMNRVEELRKEIGNRDVFIGNICFTEAFYQLALDIDSREFYLDGNSIANEENEVMSFKNNYFNLVSDPWDTDIYVVDERFADYCELLQGLGFSSEYVNHYYIFYMN